MLTLVLSSFWVKNHRKISKIKKKVENGPKKCFDQLSGAHSTWKLVKIHINLGIKFSDMSARSLDVLNLNIYRLNLAGLDVVLFLSQKYSFYSRILTTAQVSSLAAMEPPAWTLARGLTPAAVHLATLAQTVKSEWQMSAHISFA